jgi:hypothetical protein
MHKSDGLFILDSRAEVDSERGLFGLTASATQNIYPPVRIHRAFIKESHWELSKAHLSPGTSSYA